MSLAGHWQWHRIAAYAWVAPECKSVRPGMDKVSIKFVSDNEIRQDDSSCVSNLPQ